MGEDLYFSSIVTKSLEPINSDERFFEGYLTVEVKDKQGEITIVDELYKVLPVWMDRGAPISDTHSNRIIGKGINFSKTMYKSAEGTEIPAIKVTGKIHKNYELDNEIWSKIKSGEYKGLSFGGATKANRTPKVMKDGSVAYQLTDLEHYEVAVCKDPAVPLALITDFNPVAKAMADHTEDRDGKMVIKCSKFGCRVDKVDLSGIETFEGKVEALMDEGKSRESAEKIVGSFTKKTGLTDKEQDLMEKIDDGKPHPFRVNEKKDAPTGHDPTQVAHSPDTPREMELEKGKDLSNTAGDTSSMYNQNGAEQRVNSNKSCVDCKGDSKQTDVKYGATVDDTAYVREGKENKEICPTCLFRRHAKEQGLDLSDKEKYPDEEIKEYLRQRVNSKKAEPNVQQGIAGGEVPPNWQGSGSPYPEDRNKKVIKRRKLIKNESWYDLKDKAFELDMQWRVIDLVKDAMDGKGDKKPKHIGYELPQSHADQSKDIKELDHQLDGSHEEGETIGIGRDWDGTVAGMFYNTPEQGKAPKDLKRKALIGIAKKLKEESIQGKLLAGSDPEVSAQLKEHGKEIEEHHKPLKQRTRERHVQPATGKPQAGLKQLKEQERRAVNDPKDDHWGAGVGKPSGREYESGYYSMGEQKPEDVKYTGSEVKFREDTASEPRHGIRQRWGESDRDYLARKRAYALEHTSAQNLPKKMKE